MVGDMVYVVLCSVFNVYSGKFLHYNWEVKLITTAPYLTNAVYFFLIAPIHCRSSNNKTQLHTH